MYEHIERLVAEVTRDVTDLDRGGRLLRASRAYGAPPEEVWDALTNARRISEWLAPVSGELRPGGRYQLESNASGVIEACERGRRLVATWDHATEPGRISVQLAPAADGGVHLELEHSARPDPDRWNTFGPGIIGVGWDLALLGLARHLGEPGACDLTQTVQEWILSDEGRTYVRQSASAWGEAAAAAGQNRLLALEAAARAALVYAGEGSDAG